MNRKWFGTLVAAVAMLFIVAPAFATQTQPKRLEYTVTVSGQVGHVIASRSEQVLSFSGPIGIPGVGLAPGTYIFQRFDPGLVRVLSSDLSKVYATFFVTPVERTEGLSHTQVTFMRSSKGSPLQLAAWFPAGTMDGLAPVYQKVTGPKEPQMAMR